MAVFVGALAACAAGETTPVGVGTAGGDEGGGGAAPAPTAESLYAQQCSACHGPAGEGGPSGPQILSPVAGYATFVVRQGRDEMGYPGPMPAFPADYLEDAELQAVLDFLSAPPKPATGEGLYRRFCGNCHGDDARGGRVGEALGEAAREGDEFLEVVREGSGGSAYGDRTEYMPAWDGGGLTDSEVEAIRSHVVSVAPGEEDDDEDEDDDSD